MEATSKSANTLRQIKNRIRALRKKKRQIDLIEQDLKQGKSLSKDQEELLQSESSVRTRIDFLRKLSNEISSALSGIKVNESKADEATPIATGQLEMTAGPPFLTFGSFQEWSNINNIEAKEMNKERYLCISDGFLIYCLDLKQSKHHHSVCNAHHVPPLPKISTLRLPEKGLPILMGLFKLGSDAYLIGGREFTALDNKDHQSWFMNIFRSFAELPDLCGTSRVTYRLSLVDGNLCVFECKHFRPLSNPMVWPIVEKIGDQLQMIESFPVDDSFEYSTDDHYSTHSHMVLDLNDVCGGWVRIRDTQALFGHVYRRDYGAPICAHLVAGDKINTEVQTGRYYNWITKCDGPFLIDNVEQIFGYGSGRCVGGFLSGEFGEWLHVVFAIVRHDGVNAVAYLVASKTGQILCVQRLPHFFKGVVGPTSVIASVIEADDEGKTMCSILEGEGNSSDNFAAPRCLFVHTFSVEEVCDARLWIRDVWRMRSWAVEQDFVRVVVKDRYVYKMDPQARRHGNRMQACFL